MVNIAERIVTHRKTDKYGNITYLCNPKFLWKEVKVEDAINQIQSMMFRYCIIVNRIKIDIVVVKNADGKKVLKLNSDKFGISNLPYML